MRLKRTVAAATAIGLVTGGAVLTGSPAQADDGAEYVPLEKIVSTTAADESANYDKWHFDPDHPKDGATQDRNGIEFAAGSNAQIMKGNGNDIAGETPTDKTSVKDLASGLEAEVTGDKQDVTFQIPVF